MSGWVAAYVGLPHARDPHGDGPDAFSCWGLVRHVFREVHGIVFQRVAVSETAPSSPQNARAILACARSACMRRMPDGTFPADGDIVVMRSLVRLHCGLVVRANGGLRVLHSSHEAGVVLEYWREATAGMAAELWRRE
ncbi:MAG: C40 family peptidase [Gemmatimonadales bacterium]|jgi:cell wall-associated NlpC family hydrolase|nr:C40 family peptidase [Gemmatimonadales bacterium]